MKTLKVLYITPELHKTIKKLAADKEKTMQEVLKEILKKVLNDKND